MKYITTLKRPS